MRCQGTSSTLVQGARSMISEDASPVTQRRYAVPGWPKSSKVRWIVMPYLVWYTPFAMEKTIGTRAKCGKGDRSPRAQKT